MSQTLCPACQSESNSTASSCNQCGHPFQSKEKQLEFSEYEEKSFVNFKASMVLGFCILATGLFLYFYFNYSRNNPNTNQSLTANMKALNSSFSPSNSNENSNKSTPALNTTTDKKEKNIDSTPQPKMNKTQMQKVVNRYLRGVAKVEDGTEFTKQRKLLFGDLDNDGDDDVIVYFVLGFKTGGNGWWEKLAVFRNVDGKVISVTDTGVGGKLNRMADLKFVKNGKIYFDTKSWTENDGGCCPSKKGKTQYILKNKELVELLK